MVVVRSVLRRQTTDFPPSFLLPYFCFCVLFVILHALWGILGIVGGSQEEPPTTTTTATLLLIDLIYYPYSVPFSSASRITFNILRLIIDPNCGISLHRLPSRGTGTGEQNLVQPTAGTSFGFLQRRLEVYHLINSASVESICQSASFSSLVTNIVAPFPQDARTRPCSSTTRRVYTLRR